MSEHENPINGQAGSPRFERLRWPFERVAWALQDGFASLRDRFELFSRPAQALSALAAAVIAVAAVAVGIGVAGSGGTPAQPASQLAVEPPPATPTAAPVEPVADAEEQPTLAGAAPVFESAKKQRRQQQKKAAVKEPAGGEAEGSAGSGSGSATASSSGSAATDTISSSPSNSASAPASTSQASASSAAGGDDDGRPAGKKALAVAGDFAAAFVVYETGGEKAEVRKAFAGSATKELTQSLLRRPPRLPANAKVPKAKVVNVVAGPSSDGVYPVSVSLLRVGLTSELRLEMEKLGGKRWRVTNVLG